MLHQSYTMISVATVIVFALTCVCHHPLHSQRSGKNPLSWRNVYLQVTKNAIYQWGKSLTLPQSLFTDVQIPCISQFPIIGWVCHYYLSELFSFFLYLTVLQFSIKIDKWHVTYNLLHMIFSNPMLM